jgi:hypothetical protein
MLAIGSRAGFPEEEETPRLICQSGDLAALPASENGACSLVID